MPMPMPNEYRDDRMYVMRISSNFEKSNSQVNGTPIRLDIHGDIMFRKITLSKLQQNGNYFFQNGGKKLLLISLVLFQTTTYAAWEKLMTIENTTVYVDMSQGQSTQEVVTVYELRDCGEQREFMDSMYGFSFRSSQFLTEYK